MRMETFTKVIGKMIRLTVRVRIHMQTEQLTLAPGKTINNTAPELKLGQMVLDTKEPTTKARSTAKAN